MKTKTVRFENATDVNLFVHARALGGTFFVRIYDYQAEHSKPLAPKGSLSYPMDSRMAACFNGTSVKIDFAVHTSAKGKSLGIACILGAKTANGSAFLFVPA